MRHPCLLFPTLALVLLPALAPRAAAQASRAVVVKMVDVSASEFHFDPASITVHPGDTLRFTQTSKSPHNVDFKVTPAGVDLGKDKMGPFLTTVGQTYDLVLDTRFPTGTYQFACTPHELLGMKGSFTVQPK